MKRLLWMMKVKKQGCLKIKRGFIEVGFVELDGFNRILNTFPRRPTVSGILLNPSNSTNPTSIKRRLKSY
jgi:hypothetical protein